MVAYGLVFVAGNTTPGKSTTNGALGAEWWLGATGAEAVWIDKGGAVGANGGGGASGTTFSSSSMEYPIDGNSSNLGAEGMVTNFRFCFWSDPLWLKRGDFVLLIFSVERSSWNDEEGLYGMGDRGGFFRPVLTMPPFPGSRETSRRTFMSVNKALFSA